MVALCVLCGWVTSSRSIIMIMIYENYYGCHYYMNYCDNSGTGEPVTGRVDLLWEESNRENKTTLGADKFGPEHVPVGEDYIIIGMLWESRQ